MAKDIVIPSNPADLKKLKEVIEEISNSMARQDGERDYQKEAIDDLSKQFEIDKKYIRQMARDHHKDTFEKKVDEQENYQQLYESVMES